MLKLDQARRDDVEKKKEELAEVQQKAVQAESAQMSTLADANKELEEAAKADQQTEKTDDKDKKTDKKDTVSNENEVLTMSEINSFSDYASKYNTNVDYSYLFGDMQTPSAGSAFNLSDYAAIKNGSYGKLLKAYYAKQDAEKASFGGDTVQKSTLMKSGADALNNDEFWEKRICFQKSVLP